MSCFTIQGSNKEKDAAAKTNQENSVRGGGVDAEGGRRCQPIICPANLPGTLALESFLT